jgi:hypothetical protein
VIKAYIVREFNKDIGTCYLGVDGVLVRDVLSASKYVSPEVARKRAGEPETYPYEIVAVTFDYIIHEDDVIKVEPEID